MEKGAEFSEILHRFCAPTPCIESCFSLNIPSWEILSFYVLLSLVKLCSYQSFISNFSLDESWLMAISYNAQIYSKALDLYFKMLLD